MKKAIYLVVALLVVFTVTLNADKKKTSVKANAENKKSEGKITFVELGSLNCIPCKQMKKVMEEVENEYKDRINIVFYDVHSEKDADMADKYGIKLIPTQVFLDKNGKEYFRHEGYYPTKEVKRVIEEGMNKSSSSKAKNSIILLLYPLFEKVCLFATNYTFLSRRRV